MSSKKILIIVRDFIPYYHSLGGVMRVLKLAEFLTEKDVSVYILSAKGVEIDYFGYRKIVESLNITYLPDALQKKLNKNNLFRMNSSEEVDSKQGTELKKLQQISNHFRKLVNLIATPDLGIFFVYPFVKKAAEIINQYDIQNILVSSPPHSTQLIGYLLKKRMRKKINLIVEYRDSWNTVGIFRKPNRIFQFLNEELERRVLQSSDHFVYHSPPVLDKINNKFFNLSKKSTLIMNGYDSKMILPERTKAWSRDSYLRIGYFGAINDKPESYRNPERLLNALSSVDKPIKMIFYGFININGKWKDILKDQIEIHESVPHKKALELMGNIDILMLLHSQKEGADEIIPAKLFEYMLVQKPILVVGPINMESAKIVQEKKLGYTMDIYDDNDMVQKFERIYSDWASGQLVNYDRGTIKQYNRRYQFEKILRFLL